MNQILAPELARIRINQLRNGKAPSLLRYNLLKEHRIPRVGTTNELLMEAMKLENIFENKLDPLEEIAILMRAKKLVEKCESTPAEKFSGRKCPKLILTIMFGNKPLQWCIIATTKFYTDDSKKKNSKPPYTPILVKKSPAEGSSSDSLPELAPLAPPDAESLKAEEIVDLLESDFSDQEFFESAVVENCTFYKPEDRFSDSSSVSPIISLNRARKRKATTPPITKKRTKKTK
jgi:hypothetical protein